MKILGVRIDNLSREEILEKIEFFFDEAKFHQIATVNPEFVLRAQRDLEFKNILNRTDLNVADGVGLCYAFIRFGQKLKQRLAGVDLMQEVLKLANEKKLTVFLAIHRNGLSSFREIKAALNEKYPNVQIAGQDVDPRKSKQLLNVIDSSVVFCNFGFPAQEKFLNLLKNKGFSGLQSTPYQGKIRLAMGVGGSFDFVTGKIKRAPKWMQRAGLEWLWRFVQEPRYRFRRIINAVIIFPIRVLINK